MKKFLAMILSCTMMFCVSACSSESNNAAQEDNLEHIDIVLDWYPNAVHSFLYVGIEK